MDFGADRKVWGIDDQYLFGPSIMAAPVTAFGARERQVYLPQGEWHDAATGARLRGGQTVTVAAPREAMPLFVRAGAIIPAGPDVQSTGENPQGPLTIHVFAGADGRFTLYEDEGTDMGYARGQFARIAMAWDDTARTLTIGPREGSFPGMAPTRAVTVVLHDGSAVRDAGRDVFDRREGRTVTYRGEAISVPL
jgi:alpha-D-xyloside xylohydrolase